MNFGHRRSNSESASIISRASNKGKASNRLSVPYILPHLISQPESLSYTQASSCNNLREVFPREAKLHHDIRTALADESAVSDTSQEEVRESQPLDTSVMAERAVRQSDRTHMINQEDRRERPRTGRNADTTTTSTSTLASEPSLFEACRELQRRNVKVSLPSVLNFVNTNQNTTNINNTGRQGVPIIDRITPPSYPEHFLNLPAEPTFNDLCLKTVLNAGGSVDFMPRASGQSLTSNGTITCEDCNKKCKNEQDWDAHVSREKSYCPYCDGKFECHGLLLRHPCNTGRA